MGDDLMTLLKQQGEAFDAFQKKHLADLATERKEREALELRFARGGLAIEGKTDPGPEYKGLAQFVRSGEDSELKAMSVGSNPDGGFTVMPEMANAIRTKLRNLSPISALARHITLGQADTWEEPYDTSDMTASWVGENQARTAETTPGLGLLRVPLHEITTNQSVTQKLLDTSSYDLGAWLEDRIASKFARSEGAAFVTGDGIIKPRGYTTYTLSTSGDSTRTDGQLQYLATGVSADFAASNKGDKLVDLVYSLRAPFRANACFMMNSLTAGQVMKFKDGDGRYLWSESLQAGQPARLLGYPVYMDEELPDIAANSLSIAFGDFFQGYVTVDQPGFKLLRDPYSSKPNVLFYAYRRTGGSLQDSDAIKLLRFGTS